MEEGLIETTVRELESARYALSQYLSNTRLIETIGVDAFNAGAEAHQQRIDLAEMTLEEARSRQETVSTVLDGDMMRAWKAGDLTPLERRSLVSGMVDRVVLYRAEQRGKKTSADIAERVQIVLRGNQLFASPGDDAPQGVGLAYGPERRATDFSTASN